MSGRIVLALRLHARIFPSGLNETCAAAIFHVPSIALRSRTRSGETPFRSKTSAQNDPIRSRIGEIHRRREHCGLAGKAGAEGLVSIIPDIAHVASH